MAKIDLTHRLRSQEQAQRRLISLSEIGELPAVENEERRARACESLKYFCEHYFKSLFYLKWSEIHLNVISAIEKAVSEGTLQALALPRGSGKTTLCQCGILWAILTGKRRFGVLVANNQGRANQLLDDLKKWLECNDLLLEDFPEVCYPIRKLEGISQRQRSQTYRGEKTAIDWKAGILRLPTIADSPSSGSQIIAVGLTSSGLRGLSVATRDGQKIRPDVVLCDDPQDAKSAASLEQTNTRERLIKSDLLGLAGPGQKMSMLITATIIQEDDLADRLLNRSKNPDFYGIKYKLVDQLPSRLDLWAQYNDMRVMALENDETNEEATAFYREHKKEMDAGCTPSWPDRFNADEISGVQYAMNLYYRDKVSFMTEYQNEPVDLSPSVSTIEKTTIDNSLTGRPLGFIPNDVDFLTAFIDVHKYLLYYVLCGFRRDFTGLVVDFGTYPKQRRRFFKMTEATPNLFDVAGSESLNTAIWNGLECLASDILEPSLTREDGTSINVEKIGIDAGWGATHDLVLNFIKQHPRKDLFFPSLGKYYSATSRQMDDYKPSKKVTRGDAWIYWRDAERAPTGQIIFDANAWKTRLHIALNATPGDPGKLSLNGTPDDLAILVKHLSSEYALQDVAGGVTRDVWKAREKGWRDNHLLDCLTGCMVAASFNGARDPRTFQEPPKKTRKRVTFNDLRRYSMR